MLSPLPPSTEHKYDTLELALLSKQLNRTKLNQKFYANDLTSNNEKANVQTDVSRQTNL